MNLEIKKLKKDLLSDYLHFFDDIAFCDNPDWSRCYCNHFHFADPSVEDTITKEDSRSCVIDRINQGNHNGFIAYLDGHPVGWINADLKENYSRIMANEEITYDKSQKVAAIVCFVIASDHRGKGIATALLGEACEYFAKEGYDSIEAYPVLAPKNESENYHGPLKMYLANGFEVVKELSDIYLVKNIL